LVFTANVSRLPAQGFTVNVSLLPAQPDIEIELWWGVDKPTIKGAMEKTDAAGYAYFNPGSSYYPIVIEVRAPSLGLVSEVKQVYDGSDLDFILGSAPHPPPQPPTGVITMQDLYVPIGAMLLGALLAR